jgi:hypothetical protein
MITGCKKIWTAYRKCAFIRTTKCITTLRYTFPECLRLDSGELYNFGLSKEHNDVLTKS